MDSYGNKHLCNYLGTFQDRQLMFAYCMYDRVRWIQFTKIGNEPWKYRTYN